ncbi:MAG: peroxiredoxin Q/BCP [Flavobacterium sp.]|jgi:peroxiredoxin Q/BCP
MKMLVAIVCLIFAGPLFALEVGDIAPDFSLQGTDGQVHRLSDHRGKDVVVLAWFPKAYTRGCTIECKSLAEKGHLIRKFKTRYFMASVDSIEDNVGFAQQQTANFPLLSDPSKQTARNYEVLSGQGYALRHTFYIDVDGRIMAIDRQIKPASSAEDIAKTLLKLGVSVSGI